MSGRMRRVGALINRCNCSDSCSVQQHKCILPNTRGVWPVGGAVYYCALFLGAPLSQCMWPIAPMTCSNINWQKIVPHPALFTWKGAFDHLPGTFERFEVVAAIDR